MSLEEVSLTHEFLALGGGNEIGASCYLYQLGNTNLLIDAGSRFTTPAYPDFNHLYHKIGSPSHLDAFVLTHAHFDHIGALLRLQSDAPAVPKFATAPTIDLLEIMLRNTGRGRQRDADHNADHRMEMDWQSDLLDELLNTIQPLVFNQPLTISPQVRITPLYAGHILGAAALLIETEHIRILHTGDFSLQSQALTHGAVQLLEVQNVDLLVTESTYLFQPDSVPRTAQEERHALVQAVSEVVHNQGRVLIPAFALGRAQEIAFALKLAFRRGEVSPFPILLDGMVRPIADLYHQWHSCFQLPLLDEHLLYDDWIRPAQDESRYADQMAPCCVIASSGMMLPGTRSSQYAVQFLQNPRDAIFFSGYLDEESPGARLTQLEKTRQLELNGTSLSVQAQIRRYRLSAHAQSRDIRQLVESLSPRQVLYMHGDNQYHLAQDFVQFAMQQEQRHITMSHAINGIPFHF